MVDRICEDLLSKAPPMFDKEDVKDKCARLPGGPTMPLTVTLRQEIDCVNIVIRLTTQTLKNLRLAIAGTIALSGDLIEALDCLFNARIPGSWLKKSWEAATLGNWFTGLLMRFDQLNKWINNGRPKGYWLTGFFNPQVSGGKGAAHLPTCSTPSSATQPFHLQPFQPLAGLPHGDEAGGQPPARG